ncbi:MAG: hypothetical protein ABJA67_08865 [Chthonomonadales bacterium]
MSQEPKAPIGEFEIVRRIVAVSNELSLWTYGPRGRTHLRSNILFSAVFPEPMLETGRHEAITDELASIVVLGSRALPILLKHLDDPTKTNLQFDWTEAPLGGLPIDSYLPFTAYDLANIQNTKWKWSGSSYHKDIANVRLYDVTVGDICFFLVGQIVNRRFTPPSHFGRNISSPTSDPELAARTREIWSSPNPDDRLRKSLLNDFQSIKMDYDDTFEQRSREAANAASLLTYYYPGQYSKQIAWVFDGTNALGGLSNPEYAQTNFLIDLLNAVRESNDPIILSAIQRLGRRAIEKRVMFACYMCFPHPETDRLEKFLLTSLRKRPTAIKDDPREDGSNVIYDEFRCLFLLRRSGTSRAKALFTQYLKSSAGQVSRMSNYIRALQEGDGQWDMDLLTPLLHNTMLSTEQASTYLFPFDSGKATLRICDLAACMIALHRPYADYQPIQTMAQLEQVRLRLIRESKKQPAVKEVPRKVQLEMIKPFVGEYYEGNSRYGQTIRIFPDGKFKTATAEDIVGKKPRGVSGYIKVTKEHFELVALTQQVIREEWERAPAAVLPLKWGDRHYLIRDSDDGLKYFCSNINSGFEPRRLYMGYNFIRLDDYKKAVSGTPPIPAKWKPYILPKPVACRVLEQPEFGVVIVDAGSNSGLKPGMQLYQHDKYGDFNIESVTTNTANARRNYGIGANIKPGAFLYSQQEK